MSQKRPGDFETKVSLFGRMLLEASESDLQEFINDAPHYLSTQPLALLQEWKALLDARLAAEPEKNVTSMSDPHQVRLLQWDKIADRLGAEINFRTSAGSGKPSGRIANNSVRPGAAKVHTVAARRTVVRQNPGMQGKELCENLDREGISLPTSWAEAGFKTWVEAWRMRQQRIQVIFSKDRKSD